MHSRTFHAIISDSDVLDIKYSTQTTECVTKLGGRGLFQFQHKDSLQQAFYLHSSRKTSVENESFKRTCGESEVRANVK